MKGSAFKFLIISGLCLIMMSFLVETAMAEGAGTDYVIGPGDILDISVWKNEDLSKQVVVLPDGRIYFPLIGGLKAGGKTVSQLSEELREKLTRFAPDVNLSVLIRQVNSMLIYVIGRVNRPDRFVLNTNVDVLQALAMAGGLNTFANASKIKILRKQGKHNQVIPFDYDDVTKGKNLDQNIMLKRGDVVFVP